MNKKKQQNNSIVSKKQLSNDLVIKEKGLGKKIKDGLSKPTASNGTPMNELSGAAKITASLANIGGGSKEIGGGGMQDGVKALGDYQEVKGRIDEQTKVKKNNIALTNKTKKKK